ncbi:MAG: HAD family hydrolase [Geminicoccaceae bacterium]|nr:MAG: HAD family hydrolase [Geminicoccaceae bacterium]
MHELHTVAFDGDDTLWHHETVYQYTHERFRTLIERHVPHADVDGRLHATEMRNLKMFGYGVKGFTLSMIETAIELTDGAIPAEDIGELIDWGKEMLAHPVELIDGVVATLDALAPHVRLMLITKGDLFDQESKIARSGLADRFAHIEIVSVKDAQTYRRCLAKHGLSPKGFLMVGNSMRSDVMPVLGCGGQAVHVPYDVTWVHERVDDDRLPEGAWRLERLDQLLPLVERLRQAA